MKGKSHPPPVSHATQAPSGRSKLCAAAITLFLLASNGPSKAQSYGITDLGVLFGDSKSIGGGLNDTGQAAGTSSNPSNATATLFNNGKAINLGNLGGDVSLAIAINSAIQVAGRSLAANDTVFHAFLYTGGSMMDIHSASLFPGGTYAYGINKSGQVAGQGWVTNFSAHAFLYTGGQMIDLGTFPGGIQAAASAINDAGQVVGTSDGTIAVRKKTTQHFTHAFLYANGKMVDLGLPSGATYSQANAINGNGQIVGIAGFGDGAHAVLYSNGVWTDLGKFPGSSGTEATGINLSGQIVGTAFFPQQSYHPPIPGKHVPLIVRNNVLVDLNTLIAPNSGFTVTDAIGINDSGQILCNASNTTGNVHAVMLAPPH